MNRQYKRLLAILIVLCAGLGIWGLLSSVKQKIAAREARQKALREQKAPEVKVTLIEGLTNGELYISLEKQGLGKSANYAKAEKNIEKADYAFLEDNTKNTDLQGFLFPDTYRFSLASTEVDVLDTLLQNFGKKLAQASENTTQKAGYYLLPGFENITIKNRVGKGLTLFELVTLASIIEKETGRVGEPITSERLLAERRTVAGIFLNRLEQGQALQSDATVNYITKSGRASATAADLAVDSPYNTYKYPGLPPGPIANVSYSSLYAVLHPLKSDYFYFLHSQSTGEVYYAKTYDEQLKNKARYLK